MKRIIIISLCVLSAVFSSRAAGTDNTPVDTSDYAAFARTYGIVRYYSPNPYTSDWSEEDWFAVCLHFVNRLSETGDLQQVMADMAVLAPNATLTAEPQAGQGPLTGVPEEYYYKEHTGGGKIEIPKVVRMLYKEYRDYDPFYITLRACDGTPDTPQAGRVYSYPVADGFYLNLPHAERQDAFSKKETDRLLKTAKKEWKDIRQQSGKYIYPYDNRNFRLADIITRWNIIQHFYPYAEIDIPDWNEKLTEILGSVWEIEKTEYIEKNILLHAETILEAMNDVRDEHLILQMSWPKTKLRGMYVSYSYLPLHLNIVDNNVIIEAVAPDCGADIPVNSILQKVDGRDIHELLDDAARQVNSSNRRSALYSALPRTIASYLYCGSEMTVTYSTPSGDIVQDTLVASLPAPYVSRPEEGPFISYTDDGIAVIRPCQRNANYEEFAAALDTLHSMRGIVFDLRGYPMLDFDKVLGHLTEEPLPTSFISTPVTCFPNREKVRYVQSNEFLEPVAPRLNVPVVFLSDYHAMSWAETVLILVKGYDLGTIVGSESCGTNGDATQYRLPVFPFNLTANYVTNADGSRHHGVGVLPDIYIEPTLEGYLDGRDEVLEKGLEYIRMLP